MVTSCRPARINIKAVVILLLVVVIVAGGSAIAYKVRKRVIADRSLAAGKAALERKDWPEACKHLKQYLVRYPEDEAMLLRYAEASMSIRPLELENIRDALSAYRRYLMIRPGDDAASEKAARLCMQINDFEKAAEICRDRLAVDPDDADAALWLGKALIARGRADEARDVLAALAGRRPDQVDAPILLSRLAAQGGDSEEGTEALEEARRWLDLAVANNPDSAKILAHRAWLLDVDAGDPEAALADLQAADAMDPADPLVRLLMFDLWMRRGAFEQAEAQLKAIDALSPEALSSEEADPATLALFKYTAAARLELSRGGTDSAAALADRALAELADRGRTLFLPRAVELYLAGDQVAKARTCLNELKQPGRAAALAGHEADGTIALLTAAVDLRDPTSNPFDAIDGLRAVVLQDPEKAQAWKLLADGYQRSGQPLPMIEALSEYVARRPADGVAALRLARASRGRNPDQALQYAAHAERVNPGSLEARLLRLGAQLDAAAEDAQPDAVREQVRRELEALRASEPASAEVRILLAELAVAEGRSDDAITGLERAVEECDDKLKAAIELCKQARDLGRLDPALAAARQAVELQPNLAAPRILLADVHRARGEGEEARRVLAEGASLAAGREQLDARVALARFMLAGGQRDEGISLLRQLAQEFPEEVQLKLNLLRLPTVLADQGQAQALVDGLRKIEGDDGILWPVEQAKVWLHRDAWRAHRADIIEMLTRSIEAGAGRADPALLLGQLYVMEGNEQQAEEVYRQFLSGRVVSPSVIGALLALLERQGRFSEAAELLDRLPRNVSRALGGHRAQIQLGLGDEDSAAQELRERVATDPQDVASRAMLARLIYTRDKDAAAALELLGQGPADASGSLTLTASRAAILVAEQRQDEARQLLEEVVAERNDFPAHALLAGFHAQTGQLEQAEAEYRRLSTLPDASAAAYGLLARFCLESQREDEAIAALDAGLEKHPQHAGLERLLVAVLLNDEEARRERGTASQAVNHGQDARATRGAAMLAGLLEQRPNDPDLLFLRGSLLEDRGDPDSLAAASATWERLVQAAPRNVPAQLRLIGLAQRSGDLAAAGQLAVRALGANPGNAELLCAKAALEADSGSLLTARELAEQVVRAHPTHLSALNILVNVALRLGDVQAAERYNRQMLQLAGDSGSAKLNEAVVLMAKGEPDAALAHLQALYETDAGRHDVKCLLTMAQLYRQKQAYAEADKLMDEAERLAPNGTTVFKARIDHLAEQDKYDAIVALASRLPSDVPDLTGVLEKMVSTLVSSGDEAHIAEALTIARRVVEHDPDRLIGHLMLAQVAYLAGDAAAAERSYRRALEIDPTHRKGLNDLAWILGTVLNRMDEAIALADKAASQYPRDPHIRDTRGALLLQLGRLDEARNDLEQCLALSEDLPSTRISALRHLGQTLAQQGESAEARRRLSEALELDREHGVLAEKDRAEVRQQIDALPE